MVWYSQPSAASSPQRPSSEYSDLSEYEEASYPCEDATHQHSIRNLDTPVELCGETHFPILEPKFHLHRLDDRKYAMAFTSERGLRVFAILIELIGDRIRVETTSYDHVHIPIYVNGFYERECRAIVDVYENYYKLSINGKTVLRRAHVRPFTKSCSCCSSPYDSDAELRSEEEDEESTVESSLKFYAPQKALSVAAMSSRKRRHSSS
ncbi:unnamed protein product [Bursaphelenchus xylophilus]|uniref:(pine wood nematode) hypothetical protein n=1 Tax=Bursaphelenchus xylophilus TaxID=6326 RepID=A0A1I7SS01_BURXY|nr:unnamed protein product [Bursaphelenchus xylophilus]CAG9105860.1 unnamed protein product [Bursaphelenchus xylophilus]